MRGKDIIREILSYVILFAVVFAGTRLFTHYIASPLKVDGQSMYDTLEDGERLWMLKLNNIDRFDVVVFPDPRGSGKLYVKRIIGVPGDSISYLNDKLIINGQPVDEPYLASQQAQTIGNFTYDFSLEQITGQEVVPEGHYFVLGDNRRNSVDGRAFGFIEAESVLGEADLIYWPLDKMKVLPKWELSEDGTTIVQR